MFMMAAEDTNVSQVGMVGPHSMTQQAVTGRGRTADER